MRKLWMAGVIAAAALLAPVAQADDAAKERREAADATKAEMKQDAREAKAETKEKANEARTEMKEEGREAKTAAERKAGETRSEMDHERAMGTGTAQTARQEKKHPLFDGKDNFNVEGKIQKVSSSSITVAREELPAATLKISKDTKVELDGEQASATQLKQGQDVKASFNLRNDKAEAVEIKAEKANK